MGGDLLGLPWRRNQRRGPEQLLARRRTGGSDDAGRHLIHVNRIGTRLYGETRDTGLLVNNANGNSEVKQKTICAYCHPDPINDASFATVHKVAPIEYNNYVDPFWSTTPNANADTGETLTGGECAGTDCHNNLNTATAGANFGWYEAGTSTCLMCHDKTGVGSNPASGLHRITPTTSGALGIHDDTINAGGCAICHTGSGARIQLVRTNANATHINGTFTVDGPANTNRALFTNYSDAATGTCSGAPGIVGSAGCHDGAGELGTWARRWSTTAATTDGTECANCHGGFTGSDWTFGTVANTADGSVEHARNWDGDGTANEVHGNHSALGSNDTACNSCHTYPDTLYPDTTGHIGWQPAGKGTLHGDGQLQMNSTFTYSDSAFICAFACHNSNTNHNLENSNWTVVGVAGTMPGCATCHQVSGTTTETDNWTWQGTAAYTKATISGTEYTAATNGGHGRSDLPGGAKVCLDCHVSGLAHNTAGNPFLLRTTWAGANQPNTFCNYTGSGCHPATVGNHDTTAITNEVRAPWPWTPNCVNCHDPHGDDNNRSGSGGTANASMMHDDLFDKASYTYGGPYGAAPSQDANYNGFNGLVGVGDNRWSEGSTTYSGLCQECHEAGNMVSFIDDTNTFAAPHTDAIAACTCHTHAKGFEGAGCNGCHGVGTPATADGSPNGAAYPNISGRHAKHTYNAAATPAYTYNYDCNVCHYPIASQTDHTDSYNIPPGTTNPPADLRGTSGKGLFTYGAGTDADATYTDATNTCNLLNCHGQGLTLQGGATATGTIAWSATITTATGCTGGTVCHGYPPPSGAHAKHLVAAPAGPGLDCGDCHPDDTAAGGTNGFADNYSPATHVDGTLQVAMDTAKAGASAAWDDPTSTCRLTACHLESVTTNGSTIDYPAWTGSFGTGSAYCLICHTTTDSTSITTAYNSVIGGNPAPNVAYMWAGSGTFRGGHGDAAADTKGIGGGGTLPILCTACHNAAAAHFPPDSGNPKRLVAAAIDDGSKSTLPGTAPANKNELNTFCLTCHSYLQMAPGYTGAVVHHSSDLKCAVYADPLSTCTQFRWVEMSRTAEYLYTAPTTGIGPGYNPTGVLHRDDDGSASYTYTDTLPLADYDGTGNNSYNGSEPDDVVICTTCHDPHGAKTERAAGGRNFMLRVNNPTGNHSGPLPGTTCEGCHRL